MSKTMLYRQPQAGDEVHSFFHGLNKVSCACQVFNDSEVANALNDSWVEHPHDTRVKAVPREPAPQEKSKEEELEEENARLRKSFEELQAENVKLKAAQKPLKAAQVPQPLKPQPESAKAQKATSKRAESAKAQT